MNIINLKRNDSGSYGLIQPWDLIKIPKGYAKVLDNIDISAMRNHQGFVDLTIEGGVVTAITGNDAAYQAYLDSLPKPEPPAPTEMEVAQQSITDLELNDIAQGQQITDLELLILSGGGTTGG